MAMVDQKLNRPTWPAVSSAAGGIDEVLNGLEIRLAGPGDEAALADLAARAEAPVPTGTLMLGQSEGRLLAALSTSAGNALSDPSPAGKAAEAVLRYSVARLHRRERRLRRKGTAS